jgi:hypothetical protein
MSLLMCGVWVVVFGAGLLLGCSGSKKSKRIDLGKQDLAVHQHLLLVGAGPMLAKLDVGMVGKLAEKGLNRIMEKDGDASFVEGLREAGLIPRDTAMEAGKTALGELGWKVSVSQLQLESPGKKFEEVQLPPGACEEAAAAGADSVLILYERMTIDIGATEALAKSDLWGHLFDCASKRVMWRDRDKKSLSLQRFIVEAAKQVVSKENKTLADFLISLRNLVGESTSSLLKKGLSR